MTAADTGPDELRLVPPTGWGAQGRFVAAPRLASFDGVTIALLANGKANSDAILDAVADAIAQRHHLAGVVRAHKPHPSLPASSELIARFVERADVVLTAIGD
jgi:hypothetical protein